MLLVFIELGVSRSSQFGTDARGLHDSEVFIISLSRLAPSLRRGRRLSSGGGSSGNLTVPETH